jgi:uncharacterized membrane protein YhaH (DUF805 family)
MDQIISQPKRTMEPPAPKPIAANVLNKPQSSNYFSRLFSGRINRRNYIIGLLFYGLIALLITLPGIYIVLLSGLIDDPHEAISVWMPGIILVCLAMVFFSFYYSSLTVRRLHDLNKNGWFCLLAGSLAGFTILYIPVAIYLHFFSGTIGKNRYGNQPLSKINIKQDILRLL